MPFYEELISATVAEREHLLAAPVIAGCLRGEVGRESYLAFLGQAYHHVRHTTPLLMLLGGMLPDRLAWLRRPVAEYIDLPAEVMVAYAYDLVRRGNPAGFFGMVFVLEGTSAALALTAAHRIQQTLGLPDEAFSYLRSHGTLDQSHTRHLADLLEKMTPADQAEVIRRAKVFFKLYGDIFRALPGREEATWN